MRQAGDVANGPFRKKVHLFGIHFDPWENFPRTQNIETKRKT